MVHLDALEDGFRKGVGLIFVDNGPGIPDLDMALRDGVSTAGTSGTGLGALRRQADEFDIDSRTGEGTAVSVVKWKR
jgi:serine/threonine-protein kinase RsbT